MGQSPEYDLEDAAMKFARWQSQPRNFSGNVAAFEALKAAASLFASTQTALENSGWQERSPPATQVAGDADVFEDTERAEPADVLDGARVATLHDFVDAQTGQRPAGKRDGTRSRLVDPGDEV